MTIPSLFLKKLIRKKQVYCIIHSSTVQYQEEFKEGQEDFCSLKNDDILF